MATNTSINKSISCMLKKTWPGGPTNGAFLDYNRFTLLSVVGLPVCAVGVVTSTLSICLFCRDRKTPRNTRKLLIITSLVDVQFLLFSMLYLQPLTFCRMGFSWKHFFKSPGYILPIFSLVNILESLRNWLVVVIGVERFLLVCFPFRGKLWLNGNTTNCLIAACFGFAIVVRLPLIAYLSIENAGTKWSRVVSWLYQMHSFTDSILVTVIPLIILIFCSLRIGRGLRQSDRFRREQTEQHVRYTAPSEGNRARTSSTCSVVRRVKLTRGLLIVIVTFTLFMLPMVPVSIIQIISHHFFPSSCVYYVTLHICSFVAALGSQLNSMANFFIYIFYWRKYRRMLHRMLACEYTKRVRRQENELKLNIGRPLKGDPVFARRKNEPKISPLAQKLEWSLSDIPKAVDIPHDGLNA